MTIVIGGVRYSDNSHPISRDVDAETRMFAKPGVDFLLPYLAVPGAGIAFQWPIGAQGFQLSGSSQLGMHRYLGDIELDVDVMHKDEFRIVLTGVFPGESSADNMNALREVYDLDTPDNGKILWLPGILPKLQYVVGESFDFSHGADDRFSDIDYTLTVVRVGTGPKVTVTDPVPSKSGTSRKARYFASTATVNTLRKIAAKLYRNSSRWGQLYDKNASWFTKRKISLHAVPDYRLPNGTKIYY